MPPKIQDYRFDSQSSGMLARKRKFMIFAVDGYVRSSAGIGKLISQV